MDLSSLKVGLLELPNLIIPMQHDLFFRRYLGFEIHQQAAISAIIIIQAYTLSKWQQTGQIYIH